MNLDTIKREAREEFKAEYGAWFGFHERNHALAFLDTFADRLLEEVEKSVVPSSAAEGLGGDYWDSYRNTREGVLEAFAKFRGI